MNYKKVLPINRITLENGLDVVVIEKKSIPLVSINLAYKVGSKNESFLKTGMAHLFEHLMFEGSKNLPKGEFDKLCSAAGGSNNAYTTYDMTVYTMTLPSHRLELGLWLESERTSGFNIQKEALENQQKVVSEEIRQNIENQPYSRWRKILSETAYKKETPYSWDVYGKIEHVESVKLNEAEDFYSKFYKPSNACLSICGDVNFETIRNLAENYFGKIKGNNNTENLLFNDSNLIKGNKNQFNDNIPAPGIFLAFHIPGFLNDELFNFDIAANILGQGKSSRLYKSLIYEKQIASYTSAFIDKRELDSLFIIYAIAADNSTTPEILYENIKQEIVDYLNNGFSSYEFQKAVNSLNTHLAYELQHVSGIADLASQQTLFFDEPERIYKLMDIYNTIKMNKVKDLTNKYLKIEDLVRVDALPYG